MNSLPRVAKPPPTPVLIYDGDCRFCGLWIKRWRHCAGGTVEFIPFQAPETAARFPELPRARLEEAVHFIAVDGSVYRGAEAVFLSLAASNGVPLWLYRNLPGFAPCAEFFYRCVARNRPALSVLTRILWGRSVEAPTHVRTRWLFLRLLGVVYLIAFASLGTQITGLVGHNGIVPAADLLKSVAQHDAGSGIQRFWVLPTLSWFDGSDGFLQFQCVAGAVVSLLLILNIAPALSALLLWIFYLSLTTVGGVFLGYQWDNLLLEAGLLAVFLAPWQLWPRWGREAPVLKLPFWLLRWLLFRLMFSSGCVKLLSGDPSWRNLTALDYHYETQPLPTWVAWYAHQLPHWFQKMSALGMFGIELVVPFFIFLPRRPRLLAFWLLVLLQFLIALTGNYTFFNLLTVVLCVLVLDDATLNRCIPGRWRGAAATASFASGRHPGWRCQRVAAWVAGVMILLLSLPIFTGTLGWRVPWPRLWVAACQTVSPFRSVNSYGLFAVMTHPRDEIIIEGSNDDENWRAYEFKYKPGNLHRRPAFVAPHQPRLDWQMWFAALGDVRENPWFINLCLRLLQGKPTVLALLQKNPFPKAPPKFIRARVYEYHFTTPAERRATGAWWKREFKGDYCPVLSLRDAS